MNRPSQCVGQCRKGETPIGNTELNADTHGGNQPYRGNWLLNLMCGSSQMSVILGLSFHVPKNFSSR